MEKTLVCVSNKDAAPGVHSDQMIKPQKSGHQLKTELRSKAAGIIDSIIRFLAAIAGLLLAIMAIIVSYNVVMRYFVGKPPVWAIETTEYILVFSTFLAAAWVLKQDGHVKIDILVVRLPRKSQHVLNVVVAFLGIVACGLLAWYGIQATYSLYCRDVIMIKMIPWPKWVLVAPIPIGILFTLVQFIRNFLALLLRKDGAGFLE